MRGSSASNDEEETPLCRRREMKRAVGVRRPVATS